MPIYQGIWLMSIRRILHIRSDNFVHIVILNELIG